MLYPQNDFALLISLEVCYQKASIVTCICMYVNRVADKLFLLSIVLLLLLQNVSY